MSNRTYTVKKSLGGAQKYRPWDQYSEGDYVVGKFVGTHVDQYEKENYKLEIFDAGFEDEDFATDIVGKVLVLNNMGSLNSQMEKVPQGETVKVTYNGKNTLTKGRYAGKEAHSCSVDIVEVGSSDGL